jgi:PAS domain S-box-containing protein
MQNDELQCAIADADQAKADAEIAASKYSDLYDSAPTGYFTLSKLAEIIELNLTCAKMLGTERRYTINSKFGFFVSTDTLPVFNVFFDKVFQGKSQETCEVTLLKDGDLQTHVLLTGIISKNEELCHVTMVDITERKQAQEDKMVFEQQLQHSQRQVSLGQLSGGIAHNFNNILGVIIGYCGLTKRNFETANKNIPIIEKAAERAAELCRQMMAYAGKDKLSITKVNIATQVDETIVMLKSSLPPNAVIKTNLLASIPMIEGDVSQLNQVVMNLIINAAEAIGIAQGEITVSLDKIEIITGKTVEDYNRIPIPPGEYICLEVTDNGCGMDKATQSRLFEPFFTTKFTGRGLGMSASLGIIQSHGGALQLFSQPTQGTTFKIYLPALVEELTGDENESSTASKAWQGNGTILLVEDEDEIRFITKELLKMFGFTVLEASSGKEALDIYQKNAADIMLVFTDIGMPVMDGYELVEKLKKLKPELPIIISSGYGDADVKVRIGSDNIAGIASKPYNADRLWEVLKSVVEGI